MGLNIMLPFEQSANAYIDGDPKLVTMKYFFTRKLMFVKECSGVVCLPGGLGTLDDASGLDLEREIFIDRKPDNYSFEGPTEQLTEAQVMAEFASPRQC